MTRTVEKHIEIYEFIENSDRQNTNTKPEGATTMYYHCHCEVYKILNENMEIPEGQTEESRLIQIC